MKRTATVIMTAVLIMATVGAGALTGAVAADSPETPADDVAPGERMTGVVNVVEAEIEGEVAERSFGIAVATAATDEAKAEVVATQLEKIETRLDELEQHKADLDEQKEAGEMSDARYNAEVAKLAAEVATEKRMAHAGAEIAGELPADLLEDKGINVEAIQTLMTQADELSGPEVAAIAQSIAGEDVGAPVGPDREGIPPVTIPEQADEGADAATDAVDASTESEVSTPEESEEG